jgi:hypothetical protein
MVSKVELQLRSRLVKDALSSVLMEANFTVFHESAQCDHSTIAIIDFNDCKDTEFIQVLQSRGVKIVALKCETDNREVGLDEVASLSGILTYGLSADAFVRSRRLICAGERVFSRDLALERRPKAASSDIKSGFNGFISLLGSEKYCPIW